jgi:hypothetical protein
MRIRRDTAFISSLLFTIALLWLVPPFVRHVLDGRAAVHESDLSLRLYLRESAALGVASLAIILIGLIVTWAGYIKKIRWAWLLMFVIVWGWALPNLVYPDVVYPVSRHLVSFADFPAIFLEALLGHAGFPRDFARGFAQLTLIFLLMVIALALPMKSFFWERDWKPTIADSK